MQLESAAALLATYPNLSANQARALARAARSYQEALWIADSDPRQAWLRLVTAVEAVSHLVGTSSGMSLAVPHPEIAERLSRAADPELTRLVTEKLLDHSRATARFLRFFERYGPPPPRPRPAPPFRVNWRNLQEQLRTIYRYRSEDLHQGTPIPWVMCRPPVATSPRSAAPERVWVPQEWAMAVPMHLHIFEYLVRMSLQAWWKSLA